MSGKQASGEPRPGARVPSPSDVSPRPLTAPGTARVAALDALLRDIDDLRRTLETDLTLAAGAVESDAHDLAASLLESDRTELTRFQERALERLRTLEEADGVEDLDEDLSAGLLPSSVTALAPRRRSRLARLLPAAPLVAAAAALVGFLGVVPSGPSRTAPADVSNAVLSSWAELERLTASDAPPEQVQRAARDLNAVIATMVARAEGDPEAARRALELLREAELVLSADDDAAQLQQVLQQSRDLAARLLATLPAVAGSAVGAAVPTAGLVPDHAGAAAPAVRPSGGAVPTPAARSAVRQAPGSRPASPAGRDSARTKPDAAPDAVRPTRRATAAKNPPSASPPAPRPTASSSEGEQTSSPKAKSSGRPSLLSSPVIDPV